MHVLDALLYLLDSDVRAVSAMASGQTPERPLESFAQVLLEFKSGAHGHLVYGGRFPLSKNDIWIYGAQGRVGPENVVDVQTQGTLDVTLPEGPTGWRSERHQPRLLDHYQAQIEEFARCMQDGRPFESSGAAGLRSVAVTRAIIEAQRSGGLRYSLEAHHETRGWAVGYASGRHTGKERTGIV